MNILFISLLDPSESGSGNQKVTLLSAKYLSSVGIHCFIAYFKDSEYSSSQLVFDAKFKIDYNDLDGFRSFLIDNEISIIQFCIIFQEQRILDIISNLFCFKFLIGGFLLSGLFIFYCYSSTLLLVF